MPVHHDYLGWYVATPHEARKEARTQTSSGFDGRPHYVTREEAELHLPDWEREQLQPDRLEPYTVVLIATGRDEAFCEHVRVANPGDAYAAALEQVWRDSEPEPETNPFDLAEAMNERPLAAVFAGHLVKLLA